MNVIGQINVGVSDATEHNGIKVIMLRVGQRTIAYLYQDSSEDTWYIYGYTANQDSNGRTGNFRDILGESASIAEMAKRALAYFGYIPTTQEIGIYKSGLIFDQG